MPIKWKLRECLEERGITSASQVSKLVRNRTGYVLSTQAVCDLFNEQPKMIRLETSEALCNAFHCCLNDFVEVVPERVYNSPTNRPRVLKTANPIGETRKGARNNDSKDIRSARENSDLDFASYFPDARKFSS
jgi:DNA-binding Xre family transcriptional regulator